VCWFAVCNQRSQVAFGERVKEMRNKIKPTTYFLVTMLLNDKPVVSAIEWRDIPDALRQYTVIKVERM
jgi:hypothetical protein